MVYVGANDGMLHAFNGGFWNESTQSFSVASPDGSATEHPLGSELWAYVPFNLLSHLKWLVEEDYPHVYYVDGPPKVFDARIFNENDIDHPVAGDRFGRHDAVRRRCLLCRLGWGRWQWTKGSDAEMRMRSSLVLFDVTILSNRLNSWQS